MDNLEVLLEKERKLSEDLWTALDYAIIAIRKGAERNDDEMLRTALRLVKKVAEGSMEEMEKRHGP